jgi:crotonobetainyl-CoA:carnitine CoA-transferase CaiB-like acyl-CoA transferase
MRIDLPHPLGGTVPMVGSPLKLSATPVEYHHAPPLLGADTRAVLGEHLGLDEAAIEALAAQGVIGVAP